jgi:hypothetical protein
MSKQRSNTKNIKRFAAYMAAKGTPVAKPVDVYRGVWSEKTANDTKHVAIEADVEAL